MATKNKKAPVASANLLLATNETPFPRWFLGHFFGLVRRHGNTLAVLFGVCYCARQIMLAFVAFAGKQSVADLSFFANISIVWSVTFALAGLSLALYFKEKDRHRCTRERLTARITELELGRDPSRTSSLLTSKGQTMKGDE